jgi:hypothetical protein
MIWPFNQENWHENGSDGCFGKASLTMLSWPGVVLWVRLSFSPQVTTEHRLKIKPISLVLARWVDTNVGQISLSVLVINMHNAPVSNYSYPDYAHFPYLELLVTSL